MRLLVFDPFRGAAGDMITAALLQLGADREAVIGAMASVVGVPEIQEVDRAGIRSLALKTRAGHTRRTMKEVAARVKSASAPKDAIDMALRVFERISRAELAIHGEVSHFHEVGADDAVAEVVGSCTAFCSLAPDGCVVLPVSLGGGKISGSHGTYPVPAPATLAILRESGLDVVIGKEADGELCTPTGAALLSEFRTRKLPDIGFSVIATGYGAGSRSLPDIPNVLRVFLAETTEPEGGDVIDLLETNVDDVNGEIIAHATSLLFREGAYDVCTIPCIMKKGRPGHLIRVVVPSRISQSLAARMAAELGTLGVRCIPNVHRFVAKRSSLDVPVCISGQEMTVRVKIGSIDGEIISLKPEYDDVAILSERAGIPARTVAHMVENRAWEILRKKE
ncbi:MAG: nickel pincer cofactor biosynthesis protein LarC [Methanoregulaceae archaeon]|nr:nickel pincer cofactor biosynthesis protein LarC [Methanoregulaceae archaeon]